MSGSALMYVVLPPRDCTISSGAERLLPPLSSLIGHEDTNKGIVNSGNNARPCIHDMLGQSRAAAIAALKSVKAVCLVLPQNVWMAELVHELDFLEHVVAIGPVPVHLEHHHLAIGLVSHLPGKEEGG